MKIEVTCGCGSVFQAPENLAGQVVRCPSCRQAVTVPGDKPAPAADTGPDLSDLTALDQTSLENSTLTGSTLEQSAIRKAPKRRKRKEDTNAGTPVEDKAISEEVDERMTRLYEVYAGKEMRIKLGGGS